ncbi:hypothetical protein E5C31_03840 [Providencia rettgeri]|nr:hypothetical protein [Providencia rettgeri]
MATLHQEVQYILDFIGDINLHQQQIPSVHVDEDLWGQEDKIVEGVENVLRNLGVSEFSLSHSEQYVHIERKQQ